MSQATRRVIYVVLVLALCCAPWLGYLYSQRILVRLVNPYVKAAGVKLMMPEEDVVALLGGAGNHQPGFGGYWRDYPDRGLRLTFLNDQDTDFYKKVNQITVTGAGHDILGIRVGDDMQEASGRLRSHLFRWEKTGFPGLWCLSAYVVLEPDESQRVKSITLGVRDRVSSSRVY